MRLYRFDKNKRETELSLTYIRNNCRLNQVRPVHSRSLSLNIWSILHKASTVTCSLSQFIERKRERREEREREREREKESH